MLTKNEFDFVVCSAVLHHVDIRSIVPQVLDCLKPGGTAAILEPIAFSPLLQRFRDILPIAKDVSPGEHQLSKDDMDFILERLVNSRVTFFNLFGRLSRVFPSRGRMALLLLGRADNIMLTLFPFLSRFCGIVVIAGQKPFGSRYKRKSNN